MAKIKFNTIDEYIASFPDYIQKILEEARHTIKNSAPNAEEAISYRIPAFRQNEVLVYFAAFKTILDFFQLQNR